MPTDTTVAPARQKQAKKRSWWRDSVEAAAWFTGAITVAFFFHSGGAQLTSTTDAISSLGRLLGLTAASMVMVQLILISRSPWVEKAFGHDRMAKLHTRMGKLAFVFMVAHLTIIILAHSIYESTSYIGHFVEIFTESWFMRWAILGVGIFFVTVGISLSRIRPRWKYQNWHAVHLFMYVAIALVIPHQFLEGSTFRGFGVAWFWWLGLYIFSIGSFLLFRLVVPLVNYGRRGLTVTSVDTLADGSTSVVMTGRNAGDMQASAGQFFLWRFMAKGFWREAHPYSLSRTPDGSTFRITVKPSGDGSTKMAALKPGTRVMAEGPLGVFSDAARVGNRLALMAAGIGITPIRAMLEDVTEGDPVTVIVRARSLKEAPLLDEVKELAKAKGADLHVFVGSRGENWSTAEEHATLTDLIKDVASADVFVCGPVAWAKQVEAEALWAGVPAEAIHREEFAW